MRIQDKKDKERILKKIAHARTAPYNANETAAERAAAIARAKVDWEYLVKRYFGHYATADTAPFQTEWADMVAKDPMFTGFAKWGRGLAKSVWNNVIIPFGLWLREGKKYMVLISVNEKRAVRLLEDLRAEFEANPQILADFPDQKTDGDWEEALWITKGGFIGQAMGFGQSCRGLRVREKRPDHFVLDDLETRATIKNEKRQEEMVEWTETELLPAMDGDRERLIFANNWFAENMYLRKLSKLHPEWKVHEVKAYNAVTYEPAWPEKYTPDYYRKKEKRMGILSARAEYNHDARPKGKDFKAEWIQWGKLPRTDHFKIITGHWDIAYAGTETSDFNAVRIWGLKDTDFFLINSFVQQSKMKAALVFMAEIQRRLPPSVVIHWRYESQFWNGEVDRTIRETEKEYRLSLNLMRVDTPRSRKYDRILRLQGYYQNGRIIYNSDKQNHPDTQQGLKQLFGIEPNYSGHDDAPDADEQAVGFLEKYIDYDPDGGNIITGRVRPKHERI